MSKLNQNGKTLMNTPVEKPSESTQNPLKRVLKSETRTKVELNKIKIENQEIPRQSGIPGSMFNAKPRVMGVPPKHNVLGKRNKIHSEDSDPMLVNPIANKTDSFTKKYKRPEGVEPEQILEQNKIISESAVVEEKGPNEWTKIEEELDVDTQMVQKFHEDQKQGPIPAIKMTLRIFETLPKSFYKKYDCVKEIGRGAYGTVYKGLNNLTKQFVAIKRISLRNKFEDFNELQVLKGASHPNIITPLEYCVFENNLYIVSEFCEGGSLFHRILKKKSLDENICKRIALSMLSALNYCHNVKNIVHRDIKPENMVFGSEDNEDDIRLIDFGLSTILKDRKYMDKKCGSAFYLAPEVLKGQYDSKCDIWSLGVVLFVMITGRPLIYGKGQKQILAKVYGLKSVDKLVISVFRNRNPELLDFILKMLRVDPKLRWDSKQLLEHPWLKSLNDAPKTPSKNLHKTISNLFFYF
jgi:hypothetical protein